MSPTSRGIAPRVPASANTTTLYVFALLIAFRLANGLIVRTFFQPDEFYQSLEPAWQLAFGSNAGACITWEWRNQLRSSLHPMLFALVYRVSSATTAMLNLSLQLRSQLLLAAPKCLQALSAACSDYFTWKLAQKVYGLNDRAAWATLALSVLSPWQFFCSVRTFSNSLETTLTAAALSFWPRLPIFSTEQIEVINRKKSKADLQHTVKPNPASLTSRLRVALLLAALAAVLRPTNVLFWIPLGLHLIVKSSSESRHRLIGEAFVCGVFVVSLSIVADRWFYGIWTLPALQFVRLNVSQGLASFYGHNRIDYYFTEGFPLLLTTALPFAFWGIGQEIFPNAAGHIKGGSSRPAILWILSWTVLFISLMLSLISHKEVRFLYPTLPALHTLAAKPLAAFWASKSQFSRVVIPFLVLLNIIVALYITLVHQRGVIDVTDYLRYHHETRIATEGPLSRTSVGILMPCHSTPWRSHLVHSGIDIWALSCEPPLNIPINARGDYLDEADQFYADPGLWIAENMATLKGFQTRKTRTVPRREWPDNIVFFEQLEPVIKKSLGNTRYRECWRTFNSHWHDDWRRKGDVVIWCATKP